VRFRDGGWQQSGGGFDTGDYLAMLCRLEGFRGGRPQPLTFADRPLPRGRRDWAAGRVKKPLVAP
jgi:hypothetical protein